MTAEQYWEQDCTLVKYYREAYTLKQKQQNEMLWLQGLYIYEALCDVAPTLNAFAKRGTKPRSYSKEPYSLGNDEKSKKDIESDKYDKGMIALRAKLKAIADKKKK